MREGLFGFRLMVFGLMALGLSAFEVMALGLSDVRGQETVAVYQKSQEIMSVAELLKSEEPMLAAEHQKMQEITPAPYAQPTQNQSTPVLDQLRARFKRGERFEADFRHRFEDRFTGDVQVYRGRIFVTENSYMVTAEGRRLVADSVASYVYEEERNRLIISDYIEEEDEFAPSRILKGMDETYVITESAVEGEATRVDITFVSDDPFALYPEATLRLRLHRTTGAAGQSGESRHKNTDGVIPISVEATDAADNYLQIQFEQGQFTSGPITKEMLNVPADAEIIDLREEPGDTPEITPEEVPEKASEDAPEEVPEDAPQDAPENTPEIEPEDAPENTSEDAPQDAPENAQDNNPGINP